MSENFQRKVREIDARFVTRFDQALQEFRLAYKNLKPDERGQLREWLSEADRLAQAARGFPAIHLRVHVSHSHSDEEGNRVYDGSASLNPSMMLRAMDAWDAGEEFAPKGAFGAT